MEKNTTKLDPTLIPKGDYCYERISEVNPATGAIKIKPCPYLTRKEFNGVEVPWCSFLGLGGLDNKDDDQEIARLVKHFGSEEKMHEALPLFLLWDQVKECGVNSGEDDVYIESEAYSKDYSFADSYEL